MRNMFVTAGWRPELLDQTTKWVRTRLPSDHVDAAEWREEAISVQHNENTGSVEAQPGSFQPQLPTAL
jgi:hypothetical protein